ncbi:MAG: hypothetical protein D6812_16645 [Deltaproteobacteria bacterium]|nr:MAG: hypothetical protein D6812_16645 [Deltaproteobacteria bacterium]
MGECNYKNCKNEVDYYCQECRDGYCSDHGEWRNRRFLCLYCYTPEEEDDDDDMFDEDEIMDEDEYEDEDED